MAESVIISKHRDPTTLSNYHNWHTIHTVTELDVLFKDQKLAGTVKHTFRSKTNAESKEILLDSSHVLVKNVLVDGQSPKWEFAPRVEPYGNMLKIELGKGLKLDESLKVEIDLETTPACTALQWLTPEQTSNGKHPFMFSQCQAVHARSIFPCQDTPDVKATFDFRIRSPLPVVTSGIAATDNPTGPSVDGSLQTYKFHQSVPIPSYLFAIASGDLAFRSIGNISTVAASPDQVESCKWELEHDMNSFVKAADSLIYPYAWGEYNVLILPPSFPYGGMENPIYTFATPTIISGDRENVDVIAHELSHSWSGNLVSNASWEHFWLNEGWTTYIERRIQAIIHGSDEYRKFSAVIGQKALRDSINQFGESHPFTKLILDLQGHDPDDSFSSIPYEKGFTFLYYIEQLIGQANFDKFIPHYFTTWKAKSLDSYEFKATLLSFFESQPEIHQKLIDIDWATWFYAPGYPLYTPNFSTPLVEEPLALAKKWQTLTDSSSNSDFKPSPSDIKPFSSSQIVVFLESLLLTTTTSTSSNPLPPHLTQLMGTTYSLLHTRNVELSSRFYELSLSSHDKSIVPFVGELLGKVGRMKFVRPLIRGLLKMGEVDFAVECFDRYKGFWHPICVAMVRKMVLGKNGTGEQR